MIQKIIRLLIYLLLFTFPLGVLFRIKLFSNAYVVPQDIIVFFIAIFVLIYYVSKKTFPKKKSIFFMQAFFIVAGIVSLLINFYFNKDINLLVSILYTFRYLLYLSLLFVPILFLSKLKSILTISGAILLLVGFLQYFFFNDLQGLYYLGWDKHLYRLFSTFLDPNFAGVYFVLFFFFLMISIIKRRLNESYVELILAFFTFVAIYLTYSRTALASLISGIIALAIIKKKYKQLIFTLLIIGTVLFFFSDVTVEGLNPLRTASVKGRLESYSTVSSIIEKNPLIGVGFNAYRYAQVRYELRSIEGSKLSNADAGSDNSFLFVIATTGVVGFAFFISSYVLIIRRILKKKNTINIIVFCSCIVLFTASFFINALFYTPILTWIFIIISQKEKL